MGLAVESVLLPWPDGLGPLMVGRCGEAAYAVRATLSIFTL